jgi:hypothetical protein
MDCSALAPPVPDLMVTDRCDRCSAQALYRVVKGSLVLDLCGHHNKKHALALMAQGFVTAKVVTL